MIFTRDEIATWPEGHKKCSDCREMLTLDNFAKNAGGIRGRRAKCRKCRLPEYQAQYLARSFEDKMLKSAQWRASQKGIECNIDINDIVIPSVCPILNVPIELVSGSDYAPSLDRINSKKGYVKGNVMVVSKRGNTLKNNMTLDEAQQLVVWLQKIDAG